MDIIQFTKAIFQQLVLACYSQTFLKKVFYKYKDYGFKYFLATTVIISFITTFNFILNFSDFKQFLHGKEIAKYNYLNNIFKQIPDIEYKDNRIFLKNPDIYYIHNKEQKKIGVFDLENQLNYTDKSKIPLIFREKVITLNFKDNESESNFDYVNILGNEDIENISNNNIKEILLKLMQKSENFVIFIFWPVILILNLFKIGNISFWALILFLTFLAAKHKTNYKNCLRLSIYSLMSAKFVIAILELFINPILKFSSLIEAAFLIYAFNAVKKTNNKSK